MHVRRPLSRFEMISILYFPATGIDLRYNESRTTLTTYFYECSNVRQHIRMLLPHKVQHISFELPGNFKGIALYFALKTFNNYYLVSPLSNIADVIFLDDFKVANVSRNTPTTARPSTRISKTKRFVTNTFATVSSRKKTSEKSFTPTASVSESENPMADPYSILHNASDSHEAKNSETANIVTEISSSKPLEFVTHMTQLSRTGKPLMSFQKSNGNQLRAERTINISVGVTFSCCFILAVIGMGSL